jgi:hypothetical protein
MRGKFVQQSIVVLMRMGDNQSVDRRDNVEGRRKRGTNGSCPASIKSAPGVEDEPMPVEGQFDAVAANLVGSAVDGED